MIDEQEMRSKRPVEMKPAVRRTFVFAYEVRFYFLCKQCLSKMEYSGPGEAPNIVSFRVC